MSRDKTWGISSISDSISADVSSFPFILILVAIYISPEYIPELFIPKIMTILSLYS
jgi:hypothetical protein